jgi:hypothetical protein
MSVLKPVIEFDVSPIEGGANMVSEFDNTPASIPAGNLPPAPDANTDWRVRRWHVSFRSGEGWYPVGEFLAHDAATAIDRAVEVFGPGEQYQAEEIPWDAAPFSKIRPC